MADSWRIHYRWNKRGSSETGEKDYYGRTREDGPDLARVAATKTVRERQMYWRSVSPHITVHSFYIDIGVNKTVACRYKQGSGKGEEKWEQSCHFTLRCMNSPYTVNMNEYIGLLLRHENVLLKAPFYKQLKPMQWTCCIRVRQFSQTLREKQIDVLWGFSTSDFLVKPAYINVFVFHLPFYIYTTYASPLVW